ncbi:MAG: DUF5615 family PIN-like protein [Armatimonadota bacterium]
MRVLLDENLPRRLKHYLPANVQAMTVAERGWPGKKNGELLRAAHAEFDAFLTTDQGIPHQQNLSWLSMGIVVLQARSNRLEDLAALMPAVSSALDTLQPGQVVVISG